MYSQILCRINEKKEKILHLQRIMFLRWRIKNQCLLLLANMFLMVTAYAQYDFPPAGARSVAMGGATLGLDDFWSSEQNIAGSAFREGTTVGVAYRQHPISRELPYMHIAVSMAVGKQGTVMCNYLYHGSKLYNEQQLVAGYAMKIVPELSIGVTANYLHSGSNDAYYERQNLLSCAVALQYRPSRRCIVGAKVFNPLFVKTNSTRYTMRVPVVFNVGLGYLIAEDFTGVVEIEKNIYQTPNVRFGLEYCFWKIMSCRAGFSTYPITYDFGIGVSHKHLAVDIAAEVHNILGLTPVVDICWSF